MASSFAMPRPRRRRDWGEGKYRCPHCKTIKSTEEFHRYRARYNGLSVYCAACLRDLQSERTRKASAAIIAAVVAVLTEQGPMRQAALGDAVRTYLGRPDVNNRQIGMIIRRESRIERRGTPGKGGEIWTPFYALAGQPDLKRERVKTYTSVKHIGVDAEHLAWMQEMQQRRQSKLTSASQPSH